MVSNQEAMRRLFGILIDSTGNLPPLPGIFPDYATPIVRNGPEGRELALARWGMPAPAFVLQGRSSDPGITNSRNTKSPHWRRWLDREPVRGAVHLVQRQIAHSQRRLGVCGGRQHWDVVATSLRECQRWS
jgi:putative SOS response-associated peptidase YedK